MKVFFFFFFGISEVSFASCLLCYKLHLHKFFFLKEKKKIPLSPFNELEDIFLKLKIGI
jgi:hypothetical protein